MAATNTGPVPKKNNIYRYYFTLRKNDGTIITGWTGADSERSLDGAAFSDCTNEATEIGTSGFGYLELTATEMNTDCTAVKITFTNTGAIPKAIFLYPEEAGDIRVDVTQLGSSSQSATDLKDFADEGYDPSTNKIQGLVLCDTTTTNTDMITVGGVADAVWDELQSGHVTVGSFGEIATEIADILTDTNSLNDTKIPDTLSLANINTQVDTALTDIHLDHLFQTAYDPATKPGVGTALWNVLTENDGGVPRFTANALEQGPTGSSPTAADIADAVWDEAQADHTTADTFGDRMQEATDFAQIAAENHV